MADMISFTKEDWERIKTYGCSREEYIEEDYLLKLATEDIRYICGVDHHDPDYESDQILKILRAIFEAGKHEGSCDPYC